MSDSCSLTEFSVHELSDQVELLSPEILNEHRNISDLIERIGSMLGVGLGWHYLLDLTWIINKIGSLPPGSVLLDAGAGNGLLQFILAGLGYRVISADFAERSIPASCASKFHIIRVDSDSSHDNEYIRHLQREFSSSTAFSTPGRKTEQNMDDLISDAPEGTIVYYRSDISDMRLVSTASIDCVVSVSALEHNAPEKIRTSVTELQRVLKPGHPAFITVSSSRREDWFHQPSQGWCFSEESLVDLFSLENPESNFHRYDEIFRKLSECGFLRDRLHPSYFRSGNNGMPWGVWKPEYQPVGIVKLGRRRRTCSSMNTSSPDAAEPSTERTEPDRNMGRNSLSVLIDTTDGCNLRCSFCSRNNSRITKMKTEEFRIILNKILPVVQSVQLCCAWEYSIAPNAHEIVETLGNYKIHPTTIYTNGQLLPDRLAESIVDANIDYLVFSVGEAKKETYERLRKGGRYEKLLANIVKMKEIIKNRRAIKPVLCANLTITSTNIKELPEFVTIASRIGISEIRGRHLILNDGLDMRDEIVRDFDNANRIIDISRNIAFMNGVSLNVPRYTYDVLSKQCTAAWDQIYVSSNGDVSVCPRIHKYENIGNIITQELSEIIEGSARKKFQNQMTGSTFTNPVCGICRDNRETQQYINQGF